MRKGQDAPQTDEELLARVEREVDDAIGYDDTIQAQRDKAMRYYFGREIWE